jgi:hypothetical protein
MSVGINGRPILQVISSSASLSSRMRWRWSKIQRRFGQESLRCQWSVDALCEDLVFDWSQESCPSLTCNAMRNNTAGTRVRLQCSKLMIPIAP